MNWFAAQPALCRNMVISILLNTKKCLIKTCVWQFVKYVEILTEREQNNMHQY